MPPNSSMNFASFSNLDEIESEGILRDVIRENNVILGGSSIGKGLTRAACYHLGVGGKTNGQTDPTTPREDAFYVVDLGVVVSQVYQWRKFFPRVEAFYAVKCNPDPVIVRTLAVLGLNFDCASRNEIRLVQECSKDLHRQPQIIFANPCKGPAHIHEALQRGVNHMTFDNVNEVIKCASISKNIKLIMRIMTDDRGSTSRLSSKFGAPRIKWRPLLAAAKTHGLEVVGVSFHVGSGCRDASKYDLALKDAREIFDMAKQDYGFDMKVVDIGGGFPGETHSLWNPVTFENEQGLGEDDEEEDPHEGAGANSEDDEPAQLMYFQEIAESVAPAIDKYFPEESGVRIIGEPGRYIVAACATLCCSVIGIRDNQLDSTFEPEPVDDKEAAKTLNDMSRERESELIDMASGSILKSARHLSLSFGKETSEDILGNIVEELADYTRLYARRNMAQQEVDTYNDSVDVFALNSDEAVDVLGAPDSPMRTTQTVEGINSALVDGTMHPVVTLAAAGEAAVNGLVMQAVADASALQDDFAVYINDGVYGAMK